MRILFLSALYSTPRHPERGVGNAQLVEAMRPHAELSVVSPLPWYPAPVARRHPVLAALAATPLEDRDRSGSPVRHPRILHLPRIARSLYALLYSASMLRPLRAEVRLFRPDVLLAAWAYPDGAAAVALGRLLRLPTVVRVLGTDVHTVARRGPRRWQIAWALRRADHVIAISQSLMREVEALGTPRGRIEVIPTGVDQSHFHPRPRDEARQRLGLGPGLVVLVPARLSPEKGIGFFLEALARLRGTVDIQALLVGSGKLAADLQARARQLGLGDCVRFEGFQPESRMPDYYSAADLVCLPSLREGWPSVLMESFACGCPVVASAVGGSPEIVALTGTGITVPPADPVALAAAVREALARQWDREMIASRLRPHALDTTGRRYVEVCRAVAGRTSAGSGAASQIP